MTKIKCIEINLPEGGRQYVVGQSGVTEIKDLSDEWERGPEFVYEVYVGKQLHATIVNSPITIIYFQEESK